MVLNWFEWFKKKKLVNSFPKYSFRFLIKTATFKYWPFCIFETIVQQRGLKLLTGVPHSAQRCVLTISVPLGVGQAPFENSWGTYEMKNVAQKKLAFKGTFRLIPYLHKKWSLSTMNLPVQDLIRQKCFFGRCKNWRFQFQE